MLLKRTSSPVASPNSLASPALISKLKAAGWLEAYSGNGELGDSGLGTSSVMSTTVQSAPTHTKSRGNCISFIQKLDAWPLSKMKSIPVSEGRLGLPDRPLVRRGDVLAISALKRTPPIVTAGPSVWSGGGAMVVGTETVGDVAVASAVGVGAWTDVGVAVLPGVLVGVGVAGTVAVLVGAGVVVVAVAKAVDCVAGWADAVGRAFVAEGADVWQANRTRKEVAKIVSIQENLICL